MSDSMQESPSRASLRKGLKNCSSPSRHQRIDEGAAWKALAWIGMVTGDTVEGKFGEALKDGQALCHLINAVKSGTISKVETSSSPFKQMANISSFLAACRQFGVPDHALFETLDLFNEKQLSRVLRCLYALSGVFRENFPNFHGPYLEQHIPVRASFDPGAKAAVELAKGNATSSTMMHPDADVAPAWEEKCRPPRMPLESKTPGRMRRTKRPPPVQRAVSLTAEEELDEGEAGQARAGRNRPLSPSDAAGTLTFGVYEGGGKPSGASKAGGGAGSKGGVGRGVGGGKNAAGEGGVSGSGKKSSSTSRRLRERERNLRKEALMRADAEAMVALWIEGVTGETFPGKFWSSLKDGVLLCKTLNCIKPGVVPRISTADAPFPQMENITAFLAGCRLLGVADHSLFETHHLFEKRDLGLVVRCIHVLGATVQTTVPEFRGPFLGKGRGKGEGREGMVSVRVRDRFCIVQWGTGEVEEDGGQGKKSEACSCLSPNVPKKPKEVGASNASCATASVTPVESPTSATGLVPGQAALTAATTVVPPAAGVVRGAAGEGEGGGDVERDADVDAGEWGGGGVDQRIVCFEGSADEEEAEADKVRQVQTFVERRTGERWRVQGDMFESLRDGWLLGLLANALRPGVIRRVYNSIQPAKHRHNITNFLAVCRRMGVARTLLFEVDDLYSNQDQERVARTLLALRALTWDPDFLAGATSSYHDRAKAGAMASSAAAAAAALASANTSSTTRPTAAKSVAVPRAAR
ncbi:unnamed protein product [Discosporangium mesarthrocarpum]